MMDPWVLLPEELSLLRSMGHLATTWGYRAGANGNHVRFEKRTHIDGIWRAVQDITDIVFRNIQQVAFQGQTFIRNTDILPKLKWAAELPVEFIPPTFPHFLTEFFQTHNGKTKTAMVDLGSQNVSLRKNSRGFYAIVKVAEALVIMEETGSIEMGIDHIAYTAGEFAKFKK
jgi:hypothetical protein